jgi:arylsulfatase A-like enzyme
MKCAMLMFDSLNRHMLPPYGCDWTHAPNFARLAERSTTFNRSYVCSMPCMPARRDLHTGRPNFLHNAWGPIEPYDESVPAMLSQAGVYTHLATDHYHYFEDGGATYHHRYDSWEFFRGQEGDQWIGQVADPPVPENINGKGRRTDWVNRQFQRREEDLPQSMTVDAGLGFIDRNHADDRWFLQIECFDPHEPFVSHRKYKDLYPSPDDGPLFDWPNYGPVTESDAEVERARRNYAALMSKCDASVGDVLDAFDRYNLWEDTMLIVWTDHGYMLGEHGCWAKNWMPLYEEISHTPFFVWDPRSPEAAGQTRQALVQPSIDLGPTLLEFFGVERTERMTGRPLGDTLADDTPVRDAAIFGYFGERINVTDGRYVYYRLPADAANQPLYRYTTMPTKMRGFIAPEQLANATLSKPFAFTDPCPLLRIPGHRGVTQADLGDLLFDLEADPRQERPLDDDDVKRSLAEHMTRLIAEAEAPTEQYERMGLTAPAPV